MVQLSDGWKVTTPPNDVTTARHVSANCFNYQPPCGIALTLKINL